MPHTGRGLTQGWSLYPNARKLGTTRCPSREFSRHYTSQVCQPLRRFASLPTARPALVIPPRAPRLSLQILASEPLHGDLLALFPSLPSLVASVQCAQVPHSAVAPPIVQLPSWHSVLQLVAPLPRPKQRGLWDLPLLFTFTTVPNVRVLSPENLLRNHRSVAPITWLYAEGFLHLVRLRTYSQTWRHSRQNKRLTIAGHNKGTVQDSPLDTYTIKCNCSH